MKISDILGMSLMNLWRRKVRTVLTVLGVIIGTSSIVVMLSLGLGLKQSMIESLGAAGGLTEIMVGSGEEYGSDDMLLSDSTIDTFMDIENVESVQPQIMYSMPVQAGKYESTFMIVGATDEYLSNIELGEGELPKTGSTLSMIAGNQVIGDFFDTVTGSYPYWENDELPNIDLMKTALVGGIDKEETYNPEDSATDTSNSGVADPMFAVTADDAEGFGEDDGFGGDGAGDGMSDDMGDTFSGNPFSDDYYDDSYDSMSYFTPETKRVPIKVSGVVEGDMENYSEYSYYCYARIDDLKEFLHKNYTLNDVIPGQPVDRSGKPYRDLKYNQMIVRVDEADNVETVLQTIQEMGYRAEANKEWLDEIEKEFMLIEAVLGGIGAVSMLVAAISIANTMTMSIYERTKEIGIMKVLGCGLSSIRAMFLSEAAFIGFLGGIVGIGLSYLLSMVLNHFAPMFAGEIDLPTGAKISIIPLWLVIVAIIFSTIIGMIAGFFPAERATKLSPLAAIRNE